MPILCRVSGDARKKEIRGNCGETAYLQVLLTGFLPLLGHGTRSLGVREHAGDGEDDAGGADDGHGEEEDLAAFIWGRRASGAMRAECDVVRYIPQVESA